MAKGQLVKYVPEEDIQRILDYFKEKNLIVMYSISTVCLNTGLRVSDVLGLEFSNLENTSLKEIKTKKMKDLTFNYKCLECFDLLKEFYKQKGFKNYDSGFVFKSMIRPRSAITYQGVNFRMKEMKKELNINYPMNTHSFRKAWGRKVYYSFNKDLALVMKALNHVDPAVTLRYIGIDEDDLSKIYKNVIF
ncbi:tyrosine-type recombinase/integrase [Cetobacterium sp. 2A]|uniref:tyrosine-type recombinase/integrase n=1 Tax=Cetobacterium sp. 2A TaxID=2754723 RepID=UPI00163CA73A|nr:tyrosine-type recombinase/integrase [Cetobacterium sp. 2A]MBC2856998.1 tyrosine-type recombinase/integrase [Cetobacterium sp. 2A]